MLQNIAIWPMLVLLGLLYSCSGGSSSTLTIPTDTETPVFAKFYDENGNFIRYMMVPAPCETTATQDVAYNNCDLETTGGEDIFYFDSTHTCTWANIDSFTHQIYGTPTVADVGTCQLDFVRLDESSSFTVFNYTVTVSASGASSLSIADTNLDEDSGLSIIRTDAQVQSSTEGSGSYSLNHGATVFPRCTDNGILFIDRINGEISFYPFPDYQGLCNVRVDYTNATVESGSFQLTVNQINDAPEVTNIDINRIIQGELVTATPSYIDVDLDAQTWSLDGGLHTCNWMGITPATGLLSGTPDDGDVGTCNIAVIANDSTMNSTTFVKSIEVKNIRPTLSTTSNVNVTVNSGAVAIKSDAEMQADEEGEGVYSLNFVGIPSPTCDSYFNSLSIDTITGEINGDLNSIPNFRVCHIGIVFDDENAERNTIDINFALQFTASGVPTVTIDSPAPNINEDNQNSYGVLSGTCSENGRDVIVAIGGTPLVTQPVCSAGFTWSVSGLDVSGLADNPAILITADHSDIFGDNAPQATASVIKDTIDPTVTITTPAADINDTNRTNYSVSGTCSDDGQTVEVLVGVSSPAVEPICNLGAWNVTGMSVSANANGVVTITVTHYDAAGNTNQALTTVTKSSNNNNFVDVDGSIANTCAIHVTGRLFCSGRRNYGAVGDGAGTSGNALLFSELDMSTSGGLANNFTQVSVGYYVICALHANSQVLCWGRGVNGGNSSNSVMDLMRPTPIVLGVGVSAPPSNAFTQVSVGLYGGCAVHTNGQVYCWGMGSFGQLGDGTTTVTQVTPVAIDMSATGDTNSFQMVARGYHHTCGLHTNGRVYCWGRRASGSMGNGNTFGNATTPEAVDMSATVIGTNNFTQISIGERSNCALHSDSQVYCWGQSLLGQNGDGTTTERNTPTLVDFSPTGLTPLTFTAITDNSARARGDCAIHSSGQMVCWGRGEEGENADNAITNNLVPDFVITNDGSANSFVKAARGYRHLCAIHTDGQLMCAGDGNYGKRVSNSTTDVTDLNTVDISNLIF